MWYMHNSLFSLSSIYLNNIMPSVLLFIRELGWGGIMEREISSAYLWELINMEYSIILGEYRRGEGKP